MTSLSNAIRTAIAHTVGLSDIRVPHWASTFNCSEELVRLEWEKQQSRISLQPGNAFETEGK
jgi:hypothetical protein